MLLGEFVSFVLFIQTQNLIWLKSQTGDNGFGTVCKVDAGYYSQGFSFFLFVFFFWSEINSFQNNKGVYVTSKVEYAAKYCQESRKVFVIGFVMVGNPFPVIEHPSTMKYLGKSINPGYQSHFTLGILFFFPSSFFLLK